MRKLAGDVEAASAQQASAVEKVDKALDGQAESAKATAESTVTVSSNANVLLTSSKATPALNENVNRSLIGISR